MTDNAPGPFFERILYITAGVPHVMQFSIAGFVSPDIVFVHGRVNLRDSTVFDADTAANDLVDKLLPFWSDGTSFANWQIFSQPTPDDLPIAVAGNVFTAKNGTGTVGGALEEATQQQNIWRTTAGGLYKLVMLDLIMPFNTKINVLPSSGILKDLSDYLTASVGWVVGRDGGFPNTYLASTRTLNDKQRKIRRMT